MKEREEDEKGGKKNGKKTFLGLLLNVTRMAPKIFFKTNLLVPFDAQEAIEKKKNINIWKFEKS